MQSHNSAKDLKRSRNNPSPVNSETTPIDLHTKLVFVSQYASRYSTPNKKYEKIGKIGQGTFGEVFKARVKNTDDEIVALKIINIHLYDSTTGAFEPYEVCREISILRKLVHPNIIYLNDVCFSKPSRENDFQPTFCLVFDFCEHDLSGLLANKDVVFTLCEIKNMMKQLLNGLNFVHSKRILHRDLKCSNILITKGGILKLADFGMSRCIDDLNASAENNFTNKVVTLWYRAPELLLGSTNYKTPIDIWAVGCIMAEMFKKKILLPGTSEQNQLSLITALCGSITPRVWPKVQTLELYRSMELLTNQKRRLIEKLSLFIDNEDALSLINDILQLDPNKRICVDKALKHDFFINAPMPCSLRGTLSKLNGSMFAKSFIQRQRE